MSPAQRRGTSDPNVEPRAARTPESASFEAARIASRRGGRTPVMVLGFLAVLGAFVAVGIGGRSPPGPTFVAPAALASVATASPSAVTSAPAPTIRPARSPFVQAPLLTSGPGPIQLQARRNGTSMYVHGDVFVPRVTWVYVSLRDEAGHVAGWVSASVPGAAGPGRGTGPSLRFDVELALPVEFSGPVWIEANAYGAESELIASATIEAGPLLSFRQEFEP